MIMTMTFVCCHLSKLNRFDWWQNFIVVRLYFILMLLNHNSTTMCDSARLIVLYGSQTFTAKEIAERVWRTTKILGFKGPVQAMDDYPISRLIHEEFALFVCATTGQGDEPDNMKKFWKFLLRKNLPTNSLVKLKFGVVALGDSSYSKFNFVGKKLHKRLVQLGAKPLLNIGNITNH